MVVTWWSVVIYGLAMMLLGGCIAWIISRRCKTSETTPMPAPVEEEQTDPTPEDLFMEKLRNIMERQMSNGDLTVEDLVAEMGMGRTAFFNKLKNVTGMSPVGFIREERVKRAAQLLKNRNYNITEVTYMVGMNDSRYFSKCFKDTFGVTPTEYRKQA